MSKEAMRREFEAWARKHNETLREDDLDGYESIGLDRQGGVYIWANAQSAWLAWQASREALVIELPRPDTSMHNGRSDAACELLLEQWHKDRAAIEAAGVPVK